MEELAKTYSHTQVEDTWYAYWESKGYFSASANKGKKPFCIVIPPPNVTGILHMGHALNNTLQDILIRYHRMRGEEALWMPGTDHAGIATQNVVEKSIAKEGLKRQDLGRDKFIERVKQWKEQYGSTIIRQLKRLGASCDWPRERFTMDEPYSKAVTEVFVRLYEEGLIYQGSYIINWCPRCQTALSDEEAPHRDMQGNLYYLKYPLQDSPEKFVVVATTRPETMLGDTAVAVNPKDSRYKKLVGKMLILPLINRSIRIIADPTVDKKFGTGAVKVTPSHDPADYAMGKKHNLEFITVMSPDGKMNREAGKYAGMDRFQAREAVIADLEGQGLLEKIEPHSLSAGHCYRCQTIIEPYLSKQWFVKMKPLSGPAIEAVKKGKIKFLPKRWTKVYLNWMENIQDWCISRQIWWGHRIPVYYCDACEKNGHTTGGIIVSRSRPDACPACGSANIRQDDDVLDTWFSSWLWPFATFGWPDFELSASRLKRSGSVLKADLDYFYPTSALVTAPEIIFFWVARMIMAGLHFRENIPFSQVYIHGTVRDAEGRKMSKSLGNSIDPLEIIEQYGTDALRFSLISITSQGQDVFLSKERFEQGRNFANKIWNASRFVMMNLQPETAREKISFSRQTLDPVNRWILSRYNRMLKELAKQLDGYRFNEGANTLYRFFWHEFCDWYLEMVKTDIAAPMNQKVMYSVLIGFLKALHPYMPFITEEIWQKLSFKTGDSIMVQPWDKPAAALIDSEIEASMQSVFDIVTSIRNTRAEMEINPAQPIPVVISTNDANLSSCLETLSDRVKGLARISAISLEKEFMERPSSVTSVVGDAHVTIPLEGIVDIAKEKKKIEARIQKTEQEVRAKEGMLANKNFIERAPEEVVEKERTRLAELKETLQKLKAVNDGLQ